MIVYVEDLTSAAFHCVHSPSVTLDGRYPRSDTWWLYMPARSLPSYLSTTRQVASPTKATTSSRSVATAARDWSPLLYLFSALSLVFSREPMDLQQLGNVALVFFSRIGGVCYILYIHRVAQKSNPSSCWTRKRVPNGYERCSCSWGCCYHIFNSIKLFRFSNDCN